MRTFLAKHRYVPPFLAFVLLCRNRTASNNAWLEAPSQNACTAAAMSESGNALKEASREYAEAKTVALSAQLQGISVAKFEVDALPEKREVFRYRVNVSYTTGSSSGSIEIRHGSCSITTDQVSGRRCAVSNHSKYPRALPYRFFRCVLTCSD